MRDFDHSIEHHWRFALTDLEDGVVQITSKVDIPTAFVEIENFMQHLVESRGKAFKSKRSLSPHISHNAYRALLHRLPICAATNWEVMTHLYCRHRLNPYVGLFSDSVATFRITQYLITSRDSNGYINEWLTALYEGALDAEFKKRRKSFEKSAKTSIDTIENYLSGIRNDFHELKVVRLELGPSAGQVRLFGLDSFEPRSIKRSFHTLLDKLNDVAGLVGYVWKFDYTPSKAYHYTLMLFYKGDVALDDATLGRFVGEMWTADICGGQCSFINYNAKRALFRKPEFLGIGTVRCGDDKSWGVFQKAVLYFARLNYYIQLRGDGIGKTIGKPDARRKIQVGDSVDT